MKYLPLILLLASCQEPQGPVAPYSKSAYRVTAQGHVHTGDATLDALVDSGYVTFQKTFPELSTGVNTVVFVDGLFLLDGVWTSGCYTDGDSHITVAIYAGDTQTLVTICHELLHTCIGDPGHTQRIYWDKIAALAILPVGSPVNK